MSMIQFPERRMVSEIITVGPDLAMKILEKNVNNRPVVQAVVQRLARAMKNGEWEITNQGIGIDVDGNLIDGQHRLWAVVESGCTVQFLVVYNMRPEVQDRIDTGRGRTVLDAMRIAGRRMSKAEMSYLNGCAALAGKTRFRAYGVASVLRMMAPFAVGIATAIDALGNMRPWNCGPLGGGVAFCVRAWPKASEAFARALASGVNLENGSPVLALRRHIESGGGAPAGIVERRSLSIRTVSAIYAHHEGRRLAKTAESEVALQLARAAYSEAEMAEAFR